MIEALDDRVQQLQSERSLLSEALKLATATAQSRVECVDGSVGGPRFSPLLEARDSVVGGAAVGMDDKPVSEPRQSEKVNIDSVMRDDVGQTSPSVGAAASAPEGIAVGGGNANDEVRPDSQPVSFADVLTMDTSTEEEEKEGDNKDFVVVRRNRQGQVIKPPKPPIASDHFRRSVPMIEVVEGVIMRLVLPNTLWVSCEGLSECVHQPST